MTQGVDIRLARAAISWSIHPDGNQDDVADQLVALAGGNRTAVARALVRVPGGSPADELLRRTLARGEWAW
jgi:hypothetical protein